MEFDHALEQLGFRPEQERPARGTRTYAARPNRYLTYWVHAYEDGTALFTWEFAITDHLLEHGVQVGSSEALNLFMYPVEDERGPQEAAWVAGALDRAERRLSGIDFSRPEG